MPIDHTQAPIIDALHGYEKQKSISFGVPGHKGGKGAPSDIVSLLGKYAFRGDATTLKGIDDRRESKRVQQRAEGLAAAAWGAERCYFSTNGSSLSNHAAMLAAANPGDTVLVARNSHKSLIAALIIAHTKPVFLNPAYDERWDVEQGISVPELESALTTHPETKAVFVVSPNFFGVSPDLKRLAEVCHSRDIPFIVDEAWGAQYPFHPEMPPTAMRCGADLSLTSIHKTLAGLEQASIMLHQGRLVPTDRFALCYDLFESTSPSVPILASIDATRRQFMQEGKELIDELLENARWVREQLALIPGIKVMGKEILNSDSCHAVDETKILFGVEELGITGFQADDWLTEQYGISMGLSDQRNLLAIFTVGNNSSSARKLVKGVRALAEWACDIDRSERVSHPMPRHNELKTEMVMIPSDAMFGAVEHVPLDQSIGRIAAELVSPYPPGVPRLLPGQRITSSHVEYLQAGMRLGFFVLDPSDMSLQTLRVVAN
jgi:arginine decarboxylase